MLTELVNGRSVAEARALTKDDLLQEVGITLGPTRLKCALLALKVFKAAVYGLGPQGEAARPVDVARHQLVVPSPTTPISEATVPGE